MDDFYHTHDKLEELKQRDYMGNPLLHGRGLPGTHDIDLAKSVFDDIISCDRLRVGVLHLPRYNKSLNEGMGDRRSKSEVCS
jgi:D-glycerate 3-kinase